MDRALKKKRILSFVRLGLYGLCVLYALLLGNNVCGGLDLCPVHRLFGVLCSTCGATRAAVSLVKLDLAAAFEYNPVFTLSVYPIGAFLIIQDAFTIIFREITRRFRPSVAERCAKWLGF